MAGCVGRRVRHLHLPGGGAARRWAVRRVVAQRRAAPSAESKVQIVIGSISSAHPVTGAQKAEVSVCTRTPQVRDAIIAAVSGVSDCEDITDEHLDSIRTLDLSGQGITALQAQDFDGLIWVRSVDLSDNSLTALPNDGGARRAVHLAVTDMRC